MIIKLNKNYRFWKEKAGVISDFSLWCLYLNGYLYSGQTILDLLKQVFTEYKNDSHLVG